MNFQMVNFSLNECIISLVKEKNLQDIPTTSDDWSLANQVSVQPNKK